MLPNHTADSLFCCLGACKGLQSHAELSLLVSLPLQRLLLLAKRLLLAQHELQLQP